jgi:hypothetical protein
MKIRILNDLVGKERTLETDRPAVEVLRDALVTVRATRRTIYRLCIHMMGTFPDGPLTLHWHCPNEPLEHDLRFVAETIPRMTQGILTGRVRA